jgi:hypothetical protein
VNRYRVLLLKDAKISAYREASPREGKYRLHHSHYEPAGKIEAPSPYSAWRKLRGEELAQRGFRPLGVGDALEAESASLVVCNFWGFDPAEWHVPQAEQGIPPRRGEDAPSDEVQPGNTANNGSSATPALSQGT